MARANSKAFTFNGKSSADYGIRIVNVYIPSIAEERGSIEKPIGRNGDLWMGEGCYNPTTMKLTLRAPRSKRNAIGGWLTGSGKLSFSGDPGFEYSARVSKQTDFSQYTNDSDPMTEFTVNFTSYPFRYASPAPAAQSFSSSPATINNPGTVFSQPEIKIACTGAFTLVVNGYQIDGKAGASGGVIVDCELNECFNLNKTELRNTVITLDEFPRLDPGANAITWTGAITSVTITPRWRYL